MVTKDKNYSLEVILLASLLIAIAVYLVVFYHNISVALYFILPQ